VNFLQRAIHSIREAEPARLVGSVVALRGLTLLVDHLPAVVGSLVVVRSAGGRGEQKRGEVVGFDSERAIVMLLGSTIGVRAGDEVEADVSGPTIHMGRSLLGRVINGLGEPIDGGPRPPDVHPHRLVPPPIHPLGRRRIDQMLITGVRAVDLMTTVGKGQRLGIFSGPGVGKSTMLGMVARRTAADVNVIALIGERGREVREFIEDCLGETGLNRSVVVVATSDESPLMRVRAAFVACAAAEFFRDQHKDVVLMVDSITRLAHAQRQIGLAAGEPPATKGYTPSVFSLLPTLLERAGAVEAEGRRPGDRHGSITGFYNILVEGDDLTEPVSDAVRGILDGHVVLARRLAQRAHYPALDVLDSISRVAVAVSDPEHAAARRTAIRLLAAYRESEELIQIGAYASGSNPLTDAAITLKPRLDALLQQRVDEAEAFASARGRLIEIARGAERLLAARTPTGANPRHAAAGAR